MTPQEAFLALGGVYLVIYGFMWVIRYFLDHTLGGYR